MGGRQFRTIGDLRGDTLRVVCRACGHEAAADPKALYALGFNRSLRSLRFRCRNCRSTQVGWRVDQQPRVRRWRDAFKPLED